MLPSNKGPAPRLLEHRHTIVAAPIPEANVTQGLKGEPPGREPPVVLFQTDFAGVVHGVYDAAVGSVFLGKGPFAKGSRQGCGHWKRKNTVSDPLLVPAHGDITSYLRALTLAHLLFKPMGHCLNKVSAPYSAHARTRVKSPARPLCRNAHCR